MAQYFEVLSQSDNNVQQGGQFFNGNQENEQRNVRYILADDTQQFQTQQVMVVDASQPQIQGLVIDQGQIAYPQTTQREFSAVVQNPNIITQQTQQIYYMESNSAGSSENIPTTIIEQSSTMQQNNQRPAPTPPLVLNQQVGTSNPSMVPVRQLVQGTTAQKPVLQIRTPIRQGHIQLGPQNRPLSNQLRQGLPQQVRPHQPAPPQMRSTGQQVQMRIRTPLVRHPSQQLPQRPVINTQQKSTMASLINRQLTALHQKQQQMSAVAQQPQQQQQQPQQVIQQQQSPPVLQQSHQGTQIALNLQKGLNEFQRQQQQLKNNEPHESESIQNTVYIGKQIKKPLSDFRLLSEQDQEVEELDDHDPSMNSTPSHMVNYKKFLEQRQHIGKNPILARLPSNIKVTPTSSSQPQQTQTQPCLISQTIDDVINQQSRQVQPPQQQPQNQTADIQQNRDSESPTSTQNPPTPQKKPRAPPRPKNPTLGPRNPMGPRARMQRLPATPQAFTPARIIGPQTQASRFPINHPQPRFPSQQPLLQQRMVQQQQQPAVPNPPTQPPQPQQQQQQPVQPLPSAPPPPPPQQQIQQNGASQSQMNYLITPPTANRPRQQHPLPSYIPSSQIQQIIESTPIAEEFSDSIRMLVLLENGEQRLITFTLPKEACTIQEILEQVNVPFTPDTNIQVTEANTNGINYIVTVGNVSNIAYATNEEDSQESISPESQSPQQMQLPNRQLQQPPNSKPPYPPKPLPPDQGSPLGNQPPPEPPKPPTPELPKEAPPKLVPGKLAVCLACGYTGEDFNRCTRCMRKLPDNVKSVDSPIKMDVSKPLPLELAKHMSSHTSPTSTSAPLKPAPPQKSESASKPTSPKKKSSKQKAFENESVVISSDEEEDEKKPVKSVSEQLLKNLGASISISPVTKEPSLTEIKKHVRKLNSEPTEYVKMNLICRTVRIGSYRFFPAGDVVIDSKCVVVKAPVIDSKNEIRTIRIDRGDIVKVLVCFNKSLPVIFYYLNVGAAPVIRDMLNMKKESGLYYDPVDDKEDIYRKITLLPEDFGEEHKSFFNQLYGITPYNIMDELTVKEANEILIKTCPKDTSTSGLGSFSEIKQILLYPKEGQGRLNINTEDYICLAVDQFLNDKIIDFYLKYLWENLPSDTKKKVHIFSTFFYKRLTTKPTKAAKKSHPFETDQTLSAAEKRHCRVKNWTKRINLFEKDFIVVPINENAHWFLAIICFPGMRGPQTFDGKPYKPEPKIVKAPKKKPEVKKEKPIPCDDPMLSDKDEADSEDSDMESDDSEEAAAAVAAAAVAAPVAPIPVAPTRSRGGPKVPIKQPCILIFDSLAGPSRSRVVATLRDYLTVEYKSKMESERIYNRDVIKGACCKVPQQNNFTDCGLYVLQYVEQFFKDPIKDYNIPIKGINDWFEEIVVTKKREDICNLIKELMEESGTDTSVLPDIALPTLNGNLVERQETERDHDTGEDEQEDMFTDIEDSEMTDTSANVSKSEENGEAKTEESQDNSSNEHSPPGSQKSSPMKPSVEGISEKTDIVSTVTQSVLKPSLSEFSIPRQTTNKDTLNYLKSKRIIRHKTSSDGPELKKTKFEN